MGNCVSYLKERQHAEYREIANGSGLGVSSFLQYMIESKAVERAAEELRRMAAQPVSEIPEHLRPFAAKVRP